MKKIKILASRIAHRLINKIAWRFAPNRNESNSLLWRLNDWVARPSVDDYIFKRTGKTREDWGDK